MDDSRDEDLLHELLDDEDEDDQCDTNVPHVEYLPIAEASSESHDFQQPPFCLRADILQNSYV